MKMKMKVTTFIITAAVCLSVSLECTHAIQYVYIIEEQDGDGNPTGNYKLGEVHDSTLQKRRDDLQSNTPYPLVLKNDVWEVTDSKSAEDEAKKQLGDSGDGWKHNPFNVQIEGGTEWYMVTKYNNFKNAIVNAIKDHMINVESDSDGYNDAFGKKILLRAIAQLYSLTT